MICPIDNNRTERSLRGIAVGRNNWVFLGSDRGGKNHGGAAELRHFLRIGKVDPFALVPRCSLAIPTHSIQKLDRLAPSPLGSRTAYLIDTNPAPHLCRAAPRCSCDAYVEWKHVRANIDYHVEIDRHYYSVPYHLAGQLLEARFNSRTVEIFHRGNRVASHARASADYRHTVIAEHMPKSHQAHLEWTPSRIVHWAGTVGEATAQVVKTILESKPHPQMGYRACLGILRLGKAYTNARLEAACSRALQLDACSYQSLRSILKHSLEGQTLLHYEPERPGTQHRNLRGAAYYKESPPPTLQ